MKPASAVSGVDGHLVVVMTTSSRRFEGRITSELVVSPSPVNTATYCLPLTASVRVLF
jgi:hypothetical protein